MSKSENGADFNPAQKIISIQSAISGLKRDTDNPFFKSKYISLGNIVNAIKPVLHENDCYSTHKLDLDEGYKPSLTSEICYKDGTILLSCKSPLPVKDSNDPQKLGSAITYMRRYNLTALLEIEEDDDDGNDASRGQINLQKLAKVAGEDVEATQRKAAEDNFNRIKNDIENCGSVDEMASVWQNNVKVINALKKYNNDLFRILYEAKEDMKIALDPENEEV